MKQFAYAVFLWMICICGLRFFDGGLVLAELILWHLVAAGLLMLTRLSQGFSSWINRRFLVGTVGVFLFFCTGFAIAGIAIRSSVLTTLGWMVSAPLAIIYITTLQPLLKSRLLGRRIPGEPSEHLQDPE